jgi:diphthamide synthase (EF-2-diphthine--ammonia ligase)
MAGRPYDRAFLDSLPAGIDPCGENGEFHTFVHAGPLFRAPIPVLPTPPQTQGRYAYSDLHPQRE